MELAGPLGYSLTHCHILGGHECQIFSGGQMKSLLLVMTTYRLEIVCKKLEKQFRPIRQGDSKEETFSIDLQITGTICHMPVGG